jgi:amino acid adenylation domain-containing protein
MHVEVIEGYRLSPQQRHLWLLMQESANQPYSSRCAVGIEGELDSQILIAAIQSVVKRYDVLRTTFHRLSGMALPVQVIARDGKALIALNARMETGGPGFEGAAPDHNPAVRFDFELGPLLHAKLTTFAAARHRLQLDLPGMYADGASMNNLVGEIANSYCALLRGDEAASEPLQYIVFSEWQNEMLEGKEMEMGREYWRKKKLSEVASVRLPYDKSTARTCFSPRSYAVECDSSLQERIRTVAGEREVSLEAFMLTSWRALLERLTGHSGVTIGCLYDGRSDNELQRALGLMARHVPLQCVLDRETAFREALTLVQAQMKEAYAWQHYFSWEDSPGLLSSDGQQPHIPFCFEYTEGPAKYILPGVIFSVHSQQAYIDRFRLRLSCIAAHEGLALKLHFDENAYEAEEVERLCSQLIQLIRSAVGHPEWAIERLNVVSGDERRLVAVRFNQTGADYRSDGCIHQLISEQAECRPDTLAVVCGEENLTYGELNRRSQRLARRLRGRGIGPEAIVGICLGRSLLMIEAVLGVLKAGAAYLPLDPSNPKQRLSFMLADGGAELVLTESGVLEQLGDWAGAAITLDGAGEQMDMPEEGIESGAGSRNAAYVIYTSGSTGKPKGVVVEHRSALNLLEGLKAAVYPGEALHGVRVSLNAPLSFDASMQQIVMLMSGATLCVIEDYMRQDPPELIAYIGTEGIEAMDCTPSQMGMLVQAGLLERSPGRPRKLLIAGEEIDQGLWQALAGDTSRESYNIYGPTESTVDVTVSRMEPEKRRSDIGRPMVNYRVYVRELGGELGGTWMKGEIEVGGPGVARGYLKRPDLTAERFVPESEGREAGGRVYRTGDMGRYLPGGAVEYLGRKDQQLKLRGYRIEPGEIEAALRTHEAVGEALVTVRHEEGGPGRLVAYILPRTNRRGQKMDQPDSPGLEPANGMEVEARRVKTNGANRSVDEAKGRHDGGAPGVTRSELRDYLRERVPEYMVPPDFVILDKLPLTENGKVDRAALPSPMAEDPGIQSRYIAPRSETEEELASIWSDVLGVDRIGIHDNFFELGGHSLLLTQVIARMRDAFQMEVSLRAFFDSPTVAGLSLLIEEGKNELKEFERLEEILREVEQSSGDGPDRPRKDQADAEEEGRW